MDQIIYFDCFSGVSGDMALGALIDAGLNLDQLRAELQKLHVGGWRIDAERTTRYGIAGTRLHVRTEEQHAHRHLHDIAHILKGSALEADVQQRALAIFTRLADAEAAVHGTTPDQIHFHEVGALDAIVDIVGVTIGLKLLGVDRCYASALPLGTGWVNSAHGRLPVPAPATLHLLSAVRAPIRSDDTPFELVTPTGAAILAEIATFDQPPMQITATGYGFGGRDTGKLNAVRVWIGTASGSDQATDQVMLLETNIDDQPAAQIAYVAEQLLARGALDVWWTPIGMKKGRAALMLSVLVRHGDEAALVDQIMRETTTLGVRRQPIERWTADRSTNDVQTPWGAVRVKTKRWQGDLIDHAPEYEDCARLAREQNVPIRLIYAAVQEALRDDR